MGVFDTLKETIGLIQKVDNIELYRTMLELQQQVMDLVEENRTLRERLSMRERLEFRNTAYWLKDTNDGPYCSRCWDAEGKLIRIPNRGDFVPLCPNCDRPA